METKKSKGAVTKKPITSQQIAHEMRKGYIRLLSNAADKTAHEAK